MHEQTLVKYKNQKEKYMFWILEMGLKIIRRKGYNTWTEGRKNSNNEVCNGIQTSGAKNVAFGDRKDNRE